MEAGCLYRCTSLKIGVPAHYIKPGIIKRLFIQAVVFTGMFIVGEL